jgi:SAM-dependent methyltransferase
MIKTYLKTASRFLRKSGFGLEVDKLIYFYHFLKNRKANLQFEKANPDLPLPPPYMLFESYKLNYEAYYKDGYETAKWITGLLGAYLDLNKPIRILDWGCGPSRVIRHLPKLVNPGSIIAGSDYNKNTIAWNKENITGVHFILNQLQPPLDFENNSFDAIYTISIFTHLSEHLFTPWIEELHRILDHEGILMITLHGEAFVSRLEADERERFLEGEPIIHESNLDGHRSFGAFHPVKYVEARIKHLFQIEQFIPGTLINDIPQQDMWILRKQDSTSNTTT